MENVDQVAGEAVERALGKCWLVVGDKGGPPEKKWKEGENS